MKVQGEKFELEGYVTAVERNGGPGGPPVTLGSVTLIGTTKFQTREDAERFTELLLEVGRVKITIERV